MKDPEMKLDENLQRYFDRLRTTAPLDPAVVAQERASFLAHSASVTATLHQKPTSPARSKALANLFRPHAVRGLGFSKALVAILISFVLLLGSAAATVYAAQDDLPGQILYPVKTWSEAARLSLAFSPAQKLKLNLQYTNRRVDEIAHLVESGASLSDPLVNRLQNELESALLNAAELNQASLLAALNEIRHQAEFQSQVIATLIQNTDASASPLLLTVQARLREQIRLATTGTADPQQFKLQLQERLRDRQPELPATELPSATPSPSGTQSQSGEDNAQGTSTPVQNRTGAPGAGLTSTPDRYQYSSTATGQPPGMTVEGTHAVGATATQASNRSGTVIPQASMTPATNHTPSGGDKSSATPVPGRTNQATKTPSKENGRP